MKLFFQNAKFAQRLVIFFITKAYVKLFNVYETFSTPYTDVFLFFTMFAYVKVTI